MITPENKVKNNILRYFKTLQNKGLPLFYERRQSGGFSYKKGLPDMYFVYKGIHVELELKAKDGKPSSMQLMWQRKFKEVYQIDDYIVSSLEEVKEIIKKIDMEKEGD